MRRAALAALLVLACTELTGDFGEVVAIELVSPRTVSVEEQDTVRLEARAIDIQGNPVENAPLVWEVLAVDTAPVGISLDTATGLVTATAPGSWTVRARVDALPTDPVTVRVTAAPDSLAAQIDTAVVVPATALVSAQLLVRVFRLPGAPEPPAPLGDKPVTFAVTAAFPAGTETAVSLVQGNTVEADPRQFTAVSSASGDAFVQVRKDATPLPDSLVVEATARTALGAVVPGSPVRFVLHFEVN